MASLVLLLAAASPPSSLAQNSAASDPPQVTIRSTTQEVLLDLVVRDKKGRTIRDLKPEELEVLDDGAPVTVNSLRFITSDSAAADAAAAKADPMRELRLVTLVFENLGIDAQRIARQGALALIEAAAADNVYFSVLLLNQRLRLVQQFTRDRVKLERAIKLASGGARSFREVSQEVASAEQALQSITRDAAQMGRIAQGDLSSLNERGPDRTMARLMLGIIEQSASAARDERSRPTLAGLRTIAEQHASLPGRKSIVYFCEGLNVTARTRQQFESVVNAANRASVSVYAMDARGFDLTSENAAATTLLLGAAGAGAQSAFGAQDGVTSAEVHAADTTESSVRSSVRQPLFALSSATGGFAVSESNDLRKHMRRVAEEINSWYELTYTPANPSNDGRYRTVLVKATRSDLVLQTRPGYFALPPGERAWTQPFEVPLLKLLAQDPLPDALPVSSSVLDLAPQGDKRSTAVIVEIPLASVQFNEDTVKKTAQMHLSLLGLIRDSAGEVLHRFSQDIPYEAAAERAAGMVKGSFVFQRTWQLTPGKYVLELAVADRLSEKAHAERSEFAVAPSRPGPAVSGITLVRRVEPVREKSSEPWFQVEAGRVVPTLTGCPESDSAIPVYFVLSPEKAGGPAQAEILLLRSGEQIRRQPLELPSAASGSLSYVAFLPGSDLPPGPYEIRVVARQDGVEASSSLAVKLGCGAPREPATATATATATADPPPLEPDDEPAAEDFAGLRLDTPELVQALEGTRSRALAYRNSLPNFYCVQRTRRHIDRRGRGEWKEDDVITELLTYVDGQEGYKVLEVDGQKVNTDHQNLAGVHSQGEFGTVLKAIFSPEVNAEFGLRERALIDGDPVYVFAYRVPVDRSIYRVTWRSNIGLQETKPAYHGLVWVDEATYTIRRITLEAEGMPRKFPIQHSSVDIQYEEIPVGEQEVMLPVRATLAVRQRNKRAVRNDIEFTGYGRFGAQSRIISVDK